MKKYLFRLDAEDAHHKTVAALKMAERAGKGSWMKPLFQSSAGSLETEVSGIRFPNPVGLAAGFDKNAEVYHGLAALGFGYVEVGTITPEPQPGNDLPRLFRLLEDQAVINRMGFNNEGAERAKSNLQSYHSAGIPIGVNIGKNKWTPNEEAAEDYKKCLDALYSYGHYFVINISSPNTPNLRDLQEVESLKKLIREILHKKREMEAAGIEAKPVFLKVAPDMTDEQMHDVVKAALDEGLAGIIATNTTIDRNGLSSSSRIEQGGLSGAPLKDLSTRWIHEIYEEVDGQVPIIGVGGIFNGDDAYEKICAGASLIQVYTGMIYEGPGIVKKINKRLQERLATDGFNSVSDAVGSAH